MISLILYIKIFLVSMLNLMHPVHVSITNADYFVDQQKIEISSKIFKNDFKLLLYHLYELDIDLDNKEILDQREDLINEYFLNHFKIENGNSKYDLKLKEIRTDDEYLWFYYDVEIEKELTHIEIVNTILLDLYFDQKNMLIFGYYDTEKGYLFNLKQTKHIIHLHEF